MLKTSSWQIDKVRSDCVNRFLVDAWEFTRKHYQKGRGKRRRTGMRKNSISRRVSKEKQIQYRRCGFAWYLTCLPGTLRAYLILSWILPFLSLLSRSSRTHILNRSGETGVKVAFLARINPPSCSPLRSPRVSLSLSFSLLPSLGVFSPRSNFSTSSAVPPFRRMVLSRESGVLFDGQTG